MKTKIKKHSAVLLIIMIGIAVCCGLYYLTDTVWNGSFVDWFMDKYMYTHNVYSAELGQDIIVTEPRWYKLKTALLTILILIVVLCIVTALTAANLYAKTKVKNSITASSQMLRAFMNTEKEAAEIFPKEYAEISAQMSEIKATIQRHEQILKEEAARKNDLTAYLAHDLKTPLTSVIGYLSLLDEAPDMPDSQKIKYVNIALDKAHRLENLINEFFEITCYNLHQIHLEKETIDLSYMLIQMTDEFYPLLNSHDNMTNLRVDENMTLYGDPVKLARVFNNILKNAIAYSYPHTAIEIWAEHSDNGTCIYFRNKGRTIPRQKLNSIFEKFFRLDEARTANTGGAGLGLAIAKEIITLHNGEITAISENETTTFCISLPETY